MKPVCKPVQTELSKLLDLLDEKHEKKTNDSCVSITMYHTGNIADVTGPTIFLLEGKRKQEGFTDKFLVDHGAAIGSKCIMTATAFMTEDAWCKKQPLPSLRISVPPIRLLRRIRSDGGCSKSSMGIVRIQ